MTTALLVPLSLTAAVGLLLATHAAAQRRPGGVAPAQVRQLQPALDSLVRAHGVTGAAGSGKVGTLAAHASENWESGNLEAGHRYLLVGTCLEGCTDLNLRVSAPSGSKVGEDARPDKTAAVEFTAPAAGKYQVAIEMAACSPGPCAYGIKLVGR